MATGALSPVSGSPFSTGSAPIAVVVDPSGKFAYVANNNSNSVSAYSINSATGALSPIGGSAFTTGHIPLGVTIAGKSPVPFAAFMVEGDIALAPPGRFAVNGNFTVGAGSNVLIPSLKAWCCKSETSSELSLQALSYHIRPSPMDEPVSPSRARLTVWT